MRDGQASELPEFLGIAKARPSFQETSPGERIVHLYQHVHGIPVFQAARMVRFDRDGEVLDVLGDQINVHFVLFYHRPDVQLGWYVPLRLPDLMGQYDLIVAATGENARNILFCRNVVPTAVGEARACLHNPEETPLGPLAIPQPLTAYPPFRPARLPSGDWIARDRTEGSNIRCLRSNSVEPALRRGLPALGM